MNTIVVTGGAGFIGSNLCEMLCRTEHRIISIDNFNDFYNPEIKHQNIAEVEKASKGEFISLQGDIRDKAFINDVFKKYKPEGIIHLAAYAGVRPSIKNPVMYADVNINGTVTLLESMRDNGVNKMIFASSSSVYGNSDKVPFSENDSVDYPISPYAATKKAGELLCYTYSHLFDMQIACLRFFTVYGRRQRPDPAIHKFLKLIDEGGEITLFGDGNTRRDYTYIDDILDGIMKTWKWLVNGGRYDIFNLGESHTISLKEMVETIEKVFGKKAKIKEGPMMPGDVKRTYADNSKAIKILGYSPQTDFTEGIHKFVEWYRGKQSSC